MLDAKKVRLSLALLPGRVVLLVGVGRVNLHSGIYRYPNKYRRTNKSHEEKGQCTITMTCQGYALISSYKVKAKLNGEPNN